jgi:hypothetical protein
MHLVKMPRKPAEAISGKARKMKNGYCPSATLKFND